MRHLMHLPVVQVVLKNPYSRGDRIPGSDSFLPTPQVGHRPLPSPEGARHLTVDVSRLSEYHEGGRF